MIFGVFLAAWLGCVLMWLISIRDEQSRLYTWRHVFGQGIWFLGFITCVLGARMMP